MYESHFGLRCRPFAESLDPSRYVSLASREQAMRRLLYGLDQGAGAVLAFGLPGVGKSTVARRVLDWHGGDGVHLTYPRLPADELLGLLVEEFGAATGRGETASAGQSLMRLRRHLETRRRAGTRPILIVDEAQSIEDPATFEALRLLLNFGGEAGPDLAMVLVGGPEVLLRISPALSERIATRCPIHPLDEGETVDYLRGREGLAGASRPLFTAAAERLIHRASEGLPRRLNRLADLSLLLACSLGRSEADERIVELAARDLDVGELAA